MTAAHFVVGLTMGDTTTLWAMLWALCLAGLLAGPMTLVAMVQHGVPDSGWPFRSALAAWLCLIVSLVSFMLDRHNHLVMSSLAGASVVLACNSVVALVSNRDARKAETRLREGEHVTS